MLEDIKAVVRGSGDLATGVIYILHQAGFKVVATEIEEPMVVRRTVSFAEAIYQGDYEVEGIRGCKADDFAAISEVWNRDEVPVLVDPEAEVIDFLKPEIVIDATMAKKNLGTRIDDAGIVIGLGPGFKAGEDVDAVIETMRGHDLGRIITEGRAQANTGVPGKIAGYSKERVLKSSADGIFTSTREIGEKILAGEVFGHVGKEEVEAELTGIIRGLLKSGVEVKAGTKLGDIDPRNRRDNCYTISDKARSIGGAVLTAIFHLNKENKSL